MISETLLSFDYYKRKLPLYLQTCESFLSHFHIWHDFLQCIDTQSDVLLASLNIFDNNWLVENQNSDLLDKLASLYNVSRNFQVSYIDSSGSTVTKKLSLNNGELLTLIRARIIKNYFDGSTEQIQQYYAMLNIGNFVQFTESTSGFCQIIYTTNDTTNNYSTMFLAGLLTIESMGISYTRSLNQADVGLMFWDSTNWGLRWQ